MPASLSRRAKSGDGRELMSHERRALCFFAGGSSIFRGDKLLTTVNPDRDADAAPPVAARPRRNGVRGWIRAAGADGAPVRAP